MQELILGLIYRFLRNIIKTSSYYYLQFTNQPKDLEAAVNIGHKLIKTCQHLHVPFYIGNIKTQNRPTTLYDLTFPNPLTFAAYESNIPLLTMFFKLGIGGGCYKTMMTTARAGNPRPRIQEITINNTPALVNAMGLPGKGAQSSINAILASDLPTFNRPIGLSLGGESPQEYLDTFTIYNQAIKTSTTPFYYEINMSCPNTDKGQQLANNIQALETLLRSIRSQTDKVVSVKISPDQTNNQLQDIANLLSSFNKTMLTIGNTQLKTCKQLNLPTQALSRGAGGLSGPPLFARTLELTNLLADQKIPLIATGGINSTQKVTTLLEQGASLMGMATALVMNPYIIPKILKEL